MPNTFLAVQAVDVMKTRNTLCVRITPCTNRPHAVSLVALETIRAGDSSKAPLSSDTQYMFKSYALANPMCLQLTPLLPRRTGRSVRFSRTPGAIPTKEQRSWDLFRRHFTKKTKAQEAQQQQNENTTFARGPLFCLCGREQSLCVLRMPWSVGGSLGRSSTSCMKT